MIKKGTLILPDQNSLIGLDAEWTKNYKIKNGNIPFCFSVVSINKADISYANLIDGTLKFKFVQLYVENKEESMELVESFDEMAKRIVDSLDTCVFCGHQLSSDISVFINYGKFMGLRELEYISQLQQLWHDRNKGDKRVIFDSRYDISQSFLGKSRRLVDMSNDFLLDVTQPELGNSSMTKIHNEFMLKKNASLRERVSVMNLRHSLCSMLLFWLNLQVTNGNKLTRININPTIKSNLQHEFDWVNTESFSRLL